MKPHIGCGRGQRGVSQCRSQEIGRRNYHQGRAKYPTYHWGIGGNRRVLQAGRS